MTESTVRTGTGCVREPGDARICEQRHGVSGDVNELGRLAFLQVDSYSNATFFEDSWL